MAKGKRRATRHTNKSGRRQIQRGKTREQVKRIAKRLGIAYGDVSRECGILETNQPRADRQEPGQ